MSDLSFQIAIEILCISKGLDKSKFTKDELTNLLLEHREEVKEGKSNVTIQFVNDFNDL